MPPYGRRRGIWLLRLFGAIAAGLIASAFLVRVGRGCGVPFGPDRPRTVLEWSDPDTGTVFLVWNETALVSFYRGLTVRGGGGRQSYRFAYDSLVGAPGLAKQDQWVLVLDNGGVIGGYDCGTGTISGDVPDTVCWRWYDRGRPLVAGRLRD